MSMHPQPIPAIPEETCTDYVGYPFQNKQGKSCVENLARYVDKEEKTRVVVIISAFFIERISHVASTALSALPTGVS